MEKLIEFHRRVKEHKFRLNKNRSKRSAKAFHDRLFDLGEEFCVQLRDKMCYCGFSPQGHAFNSDISFLDYTENKTDKEISEKLIIIEGYISQIHKFIDNGYINRIRAYSKYLKKWHIFRFNKKTRIYELEDKK